MPQKVIARYYPTLDTVVPLDEFPEPLGFIKDGINFGFIVKGSHLDKKPKIPFNLD